MTSIILDLLMGFNWKESNDKKTCRYKSGKSICDSHGTHGRI